MQYLSYMSTRQVPLQPESSLRRSIGSRRSRPCFVARGDGRHVFSTTLREHDAAIRAVRRSAEPRPVMEMNPMLWNSVTPMSDAPRALPVVAGHGPMVVACSGGVGSGLLAYVAHRVLGGRMACVIGVSPRSPTGRKAGAVAFLETTGFRLRASPPASSTMRAIAPTGAAVLLLQARLFARIDRQSSGSPCSLRENADDRLDHRPGARAAAARRGGAAGQAGFSRTGTPRSPVTQAPVGQAGVSCLASRIRITPR
jgi:hypothetical protein